MRLPPASWLMVRWWNTLTLQRHFRVLTKFAHVESRFFGHKRQREVVLYVPVNLCDRRVCSTSVAVGLRVSKELGIGSGTSPSGNTKLLPGSKETIPLMFSFFIAADQPKPPL